MQKPPLSECRAKVKPGSYVITFPVNAFEKGAGKFLSQLARITCWWFDTKLAEASWQTFINIDRTTGIEVLADESIPHDVRAQQLAECWQRRGSFRVAGPKKSYFEAEVLERPEGGQSFRFSITDEELEGNNALWFAAVGLLLSEATADAVRLDWDICGGRLYETLGYGSDLLDACFPLPEGEPTRRERFEEHMYRAVCEWREADLAQKLQDLQEFESGQL